MLAFVFYMKSNVNAKASNLMLGGNETKPLVQHQSGEYECRLNESVCNSK